MALAKFKTNEAIEIWRGNTRLFRGPLTFWIDPNAATKAALGSSGSVLTFKYPSKMSKAYGVLPAAGTPPATPTGLAIDDVAAGYVSLSWDDLGDATVWTVYDNGVPVGSTSTASYTHTGLTPSSAHSYQVQASNSGGSSALSTALPVTTSDNTAPSWLLGDQAGVIGQAFSLTLASYADDPDGQTLTFSLISGSVPGLALAAGVYSGTPTTAGDSSLTFRVSDGYDTTDTTVTFTITDPDVTAPTVPSSVSAVANGSTVTVTWGASTDASGILRYRVFRGGVFRSNASASPYVESGVPDGTYTYSVSAVDASANANESAQGPAPPVVVAVTPPAPDVPINFTAVAATSTRFDLSWQAGPNGPVPTDYSLEYSTVGASGPWTNLPIGLVTVYQQTVASTAVQHWWRLRAFNGVEPSAGYATTNSFVQPAGQVLSTKFAPSVYLRAPHNVGVENAWQRPLGTDSVTGYTFPANGTLLWGGTAYPANDYNGCFQLIGTNPATDITREIVTIPVSERPSSGAATALRMQRQVVHPTNNVPPIQSPFLLFPDTSLLQSMHFIRFRMKFAAGAFAAWGTNQKEYPLAGSKAGVGEEYNRIMWAIKCRASAPTAADLYWQMFAQAKTGGIFYDQWAPTYPTIGYSDHSGIGPENTWMTLEMAAKYSYGSDGWAWMAMHDVTHGWRTYAKAGANSRVGLTTQIGRLFPLTNYHPGNVAPGPACDFTDFEVWTGWPSDAYAVGRPGSFV